MGVKVIRKTRNLEKLHKKLVRLHKESVSSGYFKSQGDHPTSGYSYVYLMTVHEYGWLGNAERPVRTRVKQQLPALFTSWGKKINKYLYHDKSLTYLLDGIGRDTTTLAQTIFGNPFFLASNSPNNPKGFDAPLVEDGYLRANWSWKTSNNNVVMGNY